MINHENEWMTSDQMCGHNLVPSNFTAIDKEWSHCYDTRLTNPGYPSILRCNISQPFLIISVNFFHGLKDNFLEATSDGLIWKNERAAQKWGVEACGQSASKV